MHNKQSNTIKQVKCCEVFQCDQQECPAYGSEDRRCWLFSGTHCRNEVQGKFLEKLELCPSCGVLEINMDISGMKKTLKIVDRQFKQFSSTIKERDRELEPMSMELALVLSLSY